MLSVIAHFILARVLLFCVRMSDPLRYLLVLLYGGLQSICLAATSHAFKKAPTLLFARMLLGVCFANAAKDESMLIFRAFSFFEKAWEVHLINGLEVVVVSVYVDIDGP